MEGLRNLLVARGCLYEPKPDLDYHFVGTSGRHLGGYGNLDPILCDPGVLWRVAGEFATAFGRGGVYFAPDAWPEVVVAPAIGEVSMVHLLALQLVPKLPTVYVGGVWADKMPTPPGAPTEYKIVRPGFSKEVRGKRVLIVVDFCNSLHTAQQLINEVIRQGGVAVGVCAIVYNSIVPAPAQMLGVSVFYGLEPFSYPLWEEDDCQPCRDGVPIVTDKALGHGYEFRRRHPELPDSRFVRLLDD